MLLQHLEEGGHLSSQSIKHALVDWTERHVPWKTYIFTWLYITIIIITRNTFKIPESHASSPDEIRNPTDYMELYSTIPSLPVGEDVDIKLIESQLTQTAHKFNFECLAAVHIGYPLRIAYMSSFELGEIILVDPHIVKGEGGEKISNGEETSAFGGPPKMKKRQFPIAVRDLRGFHMFTFREQAHCIMHIIETFDTTW